MERRKHQFIAVMWLVIAAALFTMGILTIALHKLEVGPASILILGGAFDLGLARRHYRKAARYD